MKTHNVLMLLAIALITGCATGEAGRPIDADQVKSISKGETTKQELLAAFGPPVSTTLHNDGSETLSWVHIRSRVTSQVVTSRNTVTSGQLQVIVDSDGVVAQSSYSESETQAKGSIF